MKSLLVSLIATLMFHSTYSQGEETWFDFWVGEWDVTWDEANGKTGKGTNKIVKILDNTVIQENFTAVDGALKGYLGTSILFTIQKQKPGIRDMPITRERTLILLVRAKPTNVFLKHCLSSKVTRRSFKEWFSMKLILHRSCGIGNRQKMVERPGN